MTCFCSCRDGITVSDNKKRNSSIFKDNQTRRNREAEHKKAKPDRRLEDMEVLHKSTNTRGSLKLKAGQRLKMENNPKLKQPKIVPNFDIELADIGDDTHIGSPLFLPDCLSDDELMPGPSEITKASALKQKLSSDHSFSNPEMDDLIRDMPIEVTETSFKRPSIPRVTSTYPPETHPKRVGAMQDSGRHNKRLKTSEPDSGKRSSSFTNPTHNHGKVGILHHTVVRL